MQSPQEIRLVPDQEYIDSYIPKPGWALIEKDILSDELKLSSGHSIWTPNMARQNETRFTMSGVIRAMCPFLLFENDYERSLASLYREGDRVGFSSTVPLVSPGPPFWRMDGQTLSEYKFVTCHLSDIICFLAVTKDEKQTILARSGAFSEVSWTSTPSNGKPLQPTAASR